MASKRLLIVEDNADDLALILRALRHNQLSCDVSVATDGVEALDQLLGPANPGGSPGALPPPEWRRDPDSRHPPPIGWPFLMRVVDSLPLLSNENSDTSTTMKRQRSEDNMSPQAKRTSTDLPDDMPVDELRSWHKDRLGHTDLIDAFISKNTQTVKMSAGC